MDKLFQPNPYAGLIIYRVQKNIEYLLINDSFSSKKHWFCPKGQVIGNEDNIKCALRETFELTGLRPTDLRIEEGFAVELRYLSGTKPKKVKYHLAQLLNNQARLLPNAQGIHMQFHNQTVCLEKVMFKSMQDVLRHAHTFIEARLQERKRSNGTQQSLAPHSSVASQRLLDHHRSKPKPSAVEENAKLASPLYKTRLCERFETEKSCPYGAKCNFAHGIDELRGKTESPLPVSPLKEEPLDPSGHQLFKTKLCEKFMKDKFCQYGPKCHFAHGEEELKERPKKQEEPVEPSPRHHQQENMDQRQESNRSSWRSTENSWRSSPRESNWRSSPRESNWRSNTPPTGSWRRSDPDGPTRPSPVIPKPEESHAVQDKTPRQPMTPSPLVHPSSPLNTAQPEPLRDLEELKRPAFVEHQIRPKSQKKTPIKKPIKPDHPTDERSWMKIVKLSKEEQDELESQMKHLDLDQQSTVNKNTTLVHGAKSVQLETITTELKKFFKQHPAESIVVKGRLSEDVKEVTKVEMRNDLSKKQLLSILLTSLLEEELESSTLTILKSRNTLFKTFVKTKADQILLLKSWDHFVTERKLTMVNKTAAVLSHWYDCELVEEDAFLTWYNTLEKDCTMQKKTVKFIEWLNESDGEDE